MFRKFYVQTVILFSLVLAGIILCECSVAVGLPDLKTAKVRVTGAPTVNAQGSVEVPVKVKVKNRGNASAGIFKVHVEYTYSGGGPFVVAFTVPGQSNLWYPFTSAPLAPGAVVTFRGKLTFHSSLHGVVVTVRAMADSCSGDEFMPDYCRVLESRENNNLSRLGTNITLP